MNNLFFTSDEHYGHGPRKDTGAGGVLRLCKRPFSSLAEMKEIIIGRNNEVVPRGRGSLVVHVGDMFWHTLTLDEVMEILDRLNGRHAFLFGNHDEFMEKYRRVMEGRFDFIYGENRAGGTKLFQRDKFLLTVDHFAKRVWQGSHKGHGHVFGHSHSALPGLGRSFDIGVDGHNFYPWHIDEIVAKMQTLTPHHTIDNTGRPDEKDNVNESVLYVGGDFETGFKP